MNLICDGRSDGHQPVQMNLICDGRSDGHQPGQMDLICDGRSDGHQPVQMDLICDGRSDGHQPVQMRAILTLILDIPPSYWQRETRRYERGIDLRVFLPINNQEFFDRSSSKAACTVCLARSVSEAGEPILV